MYKNFSGLYTALVTPFNEDKSIDYFTLNKLIDYQIHCKVNGLVILGTTGEGFAIDDNEAIKIISFVIKLAINKIKIIVGIGGNCTRDAIKKSKQAESLGADGILCIVPYYSRPTQDGMYQHFFQIAQSVNIPIILYNIKSRTHSNIEISTLLELSKHPNIVGIKEASGDMIQIMSIKKDISQDFIILSGDDLMTYLLMCVGGHGVVSVISNVFPKEIKNIILQCKLNNFHTAMKIHYELQNLMTILLSIASNPIPVKTLLGFMKVIKEEFRLPLCNLDDNKKIQLIKVYKDYING